METIDAVSDFEKPPLAAQFPYTNRSELMMSASAEFGDTAALAFFLQGLPDQPAQTTTFTEH